MKNTIILFIAFLSLSACSIIKPRDVGNHNILTLSGLHDTYSTYKNTGVLQLEFPKAAPELDTPRISVIRADKHQDYIAGARWSDFLPLVVQSALLETLKQQGNFAYVESEDGSVASRFTLHTRINQFTARYRRAGFPPDIEVSITFELQRTNGRMIRSFTLDRTVQATHNTTAAVATAFSNALESVQRELVSTLRKVR